MGDLKISLVPPITLENLLGKSVEIQVTCNGNSAASSSDNGASSIEQCQLRSSQSYALGSGARLPLTWLSHEAHFSLQVLLEPFEWSAPVEISNIDKIACEQPLESCRVLDGRGQQMILKWVKTIDANGSMVFSVYCDFELINNSGLPMRFRDAVSAKLCAGQQSTLDAPPHLFQGDPQTWYSHDSKYNVWLHDALHPVLSQH
jgi:hypothetical protein